MQHAARDESEILSTATAKLRASIMSLTFGLAGGTGLMLATVWLLLQGGDTIGPHLGLLSNYFPGYSVTWPGALLGFVYGAFVGAFSGWSLAWLYNVLATWREVRRAGSEGGA